MSNCKVQFSVDFIALDLLANVVNSCWDASKAGSERLKESSIVTIYDGNPLLLLKPSKNSNGNDVALTVSPALQVSLNGQSVKLNKLNPGNSVKAFERIGSAFRYVTKDDFFSDTDCSIRLGGQRATWANLEKGDKVESSKYFPRSAVAH